MAEFKVQAGATFETTTPKEVDQLVRTAYSDTFQELARGVKPMRFSGAGTVNDDTVTIPQPQGGTIAMGPEPGFTWRVDRVSAFGLAANDVLQVHRVSTDGSGFLGNIAAANGYLDVPEPPLLKGGEFLVVTGASLAATGQILVNGEAREVPSFMEWKLTT